MLVNSNNCVSDTCATALDGTACTSSNFCSSGIVSYSTLFNEMRLVLPRMNNCCFIILLCNSVVVHLAMLVSPPSSVCRLIGMQTSVIVVCFHL
jgi:hypothetical protein